METAIVMPLFVFLILGMLQLGLMHQARVLTKYAAYKAVRVGSIHNAKKAAMEKAALAVLLPMSGRRAGQSFFKASPGDFASSWAKAKSMDQANSDSSKLLDLTICNPTGSYTDDFDNPAGALGRDADDWQQANRGRLSIQLTFYYQLVIPFVNGVLWHIVAGTEKTELMRTLRLSPKTPKWMASGSGRTVHSFSGPANANIYILPIRASWSMRMQSNYLSKYPLPSKNECRIGWRPPGYN
ncbi:MAG: hypothetical protein AMXMBFR34_19120 [Myxococcaceae bacterium]